MDQPHVPRHELTPTGTEFSYKNTLAKAIGLTPADISFHGFGDFMDGSRRFLYGFTPEIAGRSGTFLKFARGKNAIEQLAKEVRVMRLAQQLGVSSIRVLHDFQLTSEGCGFIGLEKLSPETGTILADDDFIRGADPAQYYGARAAKLIHKLVGTVIPQDVDSTFLFRNEKRTQSPATFWELWREIKAIVLSPKYDAFRNKLIPKRQFKTLLNQIALNMQPILVEAESEDEYLVHNDTAPFNIFFSNDPNRSDTLLDFEQAAVTKNLALAYITDVSDFYNRAWANPRMQQEFLTTLLEMAEPALQDNTYRLIQAAVAFGTLYAASLYMDPQHPRHVKAVDLLSQLTGNMAEIEKVYDRLRSSPVSQLTPVVVAEQS